MAFIICYPSPSYKPRSPDQLSVSSPQGLDVIRSVYCDSIPPITCHVSDRFKTRRRFEFSLSELCLRHQFHQQLVEYSRPRFYTVTHLNALRLDIRDETRYTIGEAHARGECHHQPHSWSILEVKAFPHLSDYMGIVWHGNYMRWLEEARIKCFADVGLDHNRLRALDVDLPVLEVRVRYRVSVEAHQRAVIKTRVVPAPPSRPSARIVFEQHIESLDYSTLYAEAHVTCAAVCISTNKITRAWPPELSAAIDAAAFVEERSGGG